MHNSNDVKFIKIQGIISGLILIFVLTFVASLFLLVNSTSSIASPRFDRIGVPDGLSDHSVSCILQDRAGYMWFGTTNGGLNRYDGVDFTAFKHDENDSTSISNSYVAALFEDSKGALWVGTYGGGLSRFNRDTESFIRMFTDNDGGPVLSGNKINTIFEDSRGRLWFGCFNGLNCFDTRTGTLRTYNHDPEDPKTISNDDIGSLYEDDSGFIWIGTGQGKILNRLDPDTGKVDRFAHDEKIIGKSICGAIVPAGDGTFWLSSWGGSLRNFDPVTGTFTFYRHDPENPHSIPSNTVGYLATDKTGTLWGGTNHGLFSYDAETGHFTQYAHSPSDPTSISTNGIWPLYVDRTGILWIGTLMGGLNKLVTPETVFDYYPLGSGTLSFVTDREIFKFFKDSRGRFWVGCRSGVILTDPDFKNPRMVDSSTNYVYTVNSIKEDHEGRIWACTGRNGLKLFNEKAGKFISPQFNDVDLSGGIEDIHIHTDGTFWFCRNEGLSIYDPRSEKLIYSKTGSEADSLFTFRSIMTSLFDGHGTFWFGNSDGLNLIDISTMEVTKLFDGGDHPEYDKRHKVLMLAHGPRDTILLGTDKGLIEYSHDTTRFRTLVDSAALFQESVIALSVDNTGTIWFTTNTLLGSYNPEDETTRTFGVADGLPFNSNVGKSMYCNSDGMVYVGGNEGFYRFDPESIPIYDLRPPVEITSFKKFNREVPISSMLNEEGAIQLSYKDTFFSFGFAALDYIAPSRNEYSYKMDGFDKNWVDIGTERIATYTNLDPGTYIFRVRAANSNGVWNYEGTSVRIVITPPFWQRWWFRLSVLLAFAGALTLFYKLRVMGIKRQRKHLQNVVNRQTKSLKETNEQLEMNNTELQNALEEIQTLQGIIPICASCKDIRDDKGYWHRVEAYIRDRSDAEFSHGICPKCMEKLYPEMYSKDSDGAEVK